MPPLSDPLSLYAIPAMWFISYYPVFARSYLIKSTTGFNNVAPRGNVAGLAKNKDVSPAFAARMARMQGAHDNGLENLPFFGLAVIAGNVAGIDHIALNTASGLYLVWRIAYNYIYFNQSTPRMAALRTLNWVSSLVFPFYLLFKSANAFGAKSQN